VQQTSFSSSHSANFAVLIAQAQAQDEQIFQQSLLAYAAEKTKWNKVKSVARRILAGEHKAFIEALVEFSPLAEISDLGSSLHFTVHRTKLIECEIKVNGTQAIPSEIKTLTSGGKLSIRSITKGHFHEIYQDYVCGCILRVAREVLAMLPVEVVLVTASADFLEPRTGQFTEQSVLSTAMPRAVIAQSLDIEHNPQAREKWLQASYRRVERRERFMSRLSVLDDGEMALDGKEA